ncbi:alpha/beta hydrolase family protein [Flectobacillus roseus]
MFSQRTTFLSSSTFSDINSDDDRNVPFSETVTIAEALRKNDVYMEQLIFPDEVHSFLLC